MSWVHINGFRCVPLSFQCHGMVIGCKKKKLQWYRKGPNVYYEVWYLCISLCPQQRSNNAIRIVCTSAFYERWVYRIFSRLFVFGWIWFPTQRDCYVFSWKCQPYILVVFISNLARSFFNVKTPKFMFFV